MNEPVGPKRWGSLAAKPLAGALVAGVLGMGELQGGREGGHEALPATPATTLRVAPLAGEGDFTTIQQAVDAARPGDVIAVRGGHYPEAIVFPRGGEPGRPITLRAEPGHLVVITPTPPLAGMPQPVPGSAYLYRWPAAALPAGDPEKLGLWEPASQTRLVRVDSPDAAERRLGSWALDSATGDLFIRSTGLAPAGDLVYHFELADRHGIHVRHAHVTIEGVSVAFGDHGILLDRGSEHVTVRGCRLFCNRRAGIHATGAHHVLSENELTRNNQYGIQMRYGLERVRVVGNRAFHNGPSNGQGTDTSVAADIGIYSKASDVHFEANLVESSAPFAFRNKFAGNPTVTARGNVVRGNIEWAGTFLDHNTFLVGSPGPRSGFFVNQVQPGPAGDPAIVDAEGRMRRTALVHPALHPQAPHFADPAHHDYRLTEASPYHGQGAFPAHARVLYVDPQRGEDTHSGLAPDRPWRSLAHLVERLHPGDTVYLMPGEYDAALAISVSGLSAREPLRFRAFGRSPQVVLRGGVQLQGVRHVELDGLSIHGQPIRITESEDFHLRHTVIADQQVGLVITKSSGIALDRLTFYGVERALVVEQSDSLQLRHSLFEAVATPWELDAASESELYADHNHYGAFRAKRGEAVLTDLAAWQAATAQDRASTQGPVALGAAAQLPAHSPLSYAGADLGFIGARPEAAADRLAVQGLRAAGLTPHTASLLWRTPRGLTEAEVFLTDRQSGEQRRLVPHGTFQIMGHVFDMTFRTAGYFSIDHHLGLGALEPGRTYDVRLRVRSPQGDAAHEVELTFETPNDQQAPRTLYVGPAGSDTADGTAPQRAWATFDHASSQARPGDTVLVLPGVYHQTLAPRVSGTSQRPIVFRSAVPREAVLDLRGVLPAAVEIMHVDHVHVLDFSMRGGAFSRGNNVLIGQARGIRIAGNKVELPEVASWERLRLGHGGLVASHAPQLVVEDNVFACGYVGVGLAASPGAVVRHNVIIGEGNYGVVMVPDDPEERYQVTDNLFYRTIMGYKTGCHVWMMNVAAQLESDRNLFFVPADHKATIGQLPGTERLTTLADWQATGHDRHSVMAEPVFADREAGDFRLAPDSPGRERGEGVLSVGVRW